MQGSTHLGNVSEKANITRKMLKKWKMTYLGHYHNTHEITKEIVHLPSFRQNNFGEDNNKGFTVIYDDLSYKVIKGRFKEFYKLSIDIDTVTSKEIDSLLELHGGSSNIVRFEFYGDESKLRALNKTKFKEANIDVKVKYESIFEVDAFVKPTMIKVFDEKSVQERFEKFCEEKGYDWEEGVALLNKFLKKKNEET